MPVVNHNIIVATVSKAPVHRPLSPETVAPRRPWMEAINSEAWSFKCLHSWEEPVLRVRAVLLDVHRDVQAEKRPLALMSVHMQHTLAYVVQEHTHRRSSCAENILFTP